MENLSPVKLIESLKWRYATKKFNSEKKINNKNWECLEQALILSPSSYGLQPWKFLIVQNTEIKASRNLENNKSRTTENK